MNRPGNFSRFWRLLHPTARRSRLPFSRRASIFLQPRTGRRLFSSERDRLMNRLNNRTITPQEVRVLIETQESNEPSIRSMHQADSEAAAMASAVGSRVNPLYTRRVTGWKEIVLSLFPLVFIFWAFGGFDMLKMRRSASSGVGSGAGAGGGLPGMFGKNFTEWTETDWEDDDEAENDEDAESSNALDPRGMIADPRDDFFARLGISMDGKRVPTSFGKLKVKSDGSNSKNGNKKRRKRTRFSDVCGNDEAKIDMMDLVDYLKNPSKYTEMGCKLPKGVLLYGAPGTGKTLLARALAGESGVPFLSCNGASFDEIFVGVGVQRVRRLFERAKELSPCIIFIDEIDAIANTRLSVGSAHSSDSLNALLSELDGFDSGKGDVMSGVVVVAATNMVDRLDPALVRPGRFDRKIKVNLPDKAARRDIVSLYLNRLKLTRPNRDEIDIKLDELVGDIHGFSGAELENMVNLASIEAVKNNQSELLYSNLVEAKEQIAMGRARANMQLSELQYKLTAYHESGHAIVSIFTSGSKNIYKATILPRGDALGYVASTNTDEFMSTKETLKSHLDMCMGGRIAEEIIFGKDQITTGASSDFHQATDLATAMVVHYGMSDAVGNVFYKTDELHHLSPDLQNLINAEIKLLLEQSELRARAVLTEHEHDLHTLANELLDKETLTGRQIKELLGIVDGDDGQNNDAGEETTTPVKTNGKTRRGRRHSKPDSKEQGYAEIAQPLI